MKDSFKYAVTANDVKLFKHAKRLSVIEKHKASPILVHISPTNLCNADCKFCCFENRDKHLSLDINKLKNSLDQFYDLGLRAVEMAGGGEPSMYPHINEFLNHASKKGVALGINTNALSMEKISDWGIFKWIRVNVAMLDSKNPAIVERFKKNARHLSTLSTVTSCYIVSPSFKEEQLDRVIAFVNEAKIPTRLAPDCTQSKEQIQALLDKLTALKVEQRSDHIFLSGFNVYLGERPDNVCMIHLIKPFLYSDGYVYVCPSSELAVENNRTMQDKFKACRMEDVYDFYTKEFKIFHHDCSYCKYTPQNIILHRIATEGMTSVLIDELQKYLPETEFNEFV